MSFRNYLNQIRALRTPESYADLERRATAAYDAFTRQAMHHRGKGQNHDPHVPRSRTIATLIATMHELDQAGHGDTIIELSSPSREAIEAS